MASRRQRSARLRPSTVITVVRCDTRKTISAPRSASKDSSGQSLAASICICPSKVINKVQSEPGVCRAVSRIRSAYRASVSTLISSARRLRV